WPFAAKDKLQRTVASKTSLSCHFEDWCFYNTIYKVIQETCENIWQALAPLFLKAPTVEKWNEIAEHFYNRWNLPNCVGSIDGKHIRIQCPPRSGSEFFNYKKYFSLVLMACCDANYCFTWVEIGDYGSLPDSSIFGNSALGRALETRSLNLPPSKELPGTSYKMPHFFVGDEAFPLRSDLMRPYSKKSIKSDTERIFNYRLSRARRIIENAFGILSSRWRVLHTCIRMKVESVEKIVLATTCLHNFMMMREDREDERKLYCPTTYIDNENGSNGIVTQGIWRDTAPCLKLNNIGRFGSNNATRTAITQRTTLAEWMLTDEGQVP
ncbi:PREDICTED: uncharacterized protein LOC105560570, partial [Vollenhovia emeryi]|uniref:uncharacterized protein LOC105560570 n=1 Tax=Vollenhovia emeryi TaxID=411798 RepID=UPI0005F50435